MTPIAVPEALRVLALAGIYVVVARLGLKVDAVAGFASLVWPATGIALSALVLFGYRMWSGVFIGAVAANALSGAPLLVALGIGAGNTLEALGGAYLLRSVPGFRPSLDRLIDVLALIVLGAGLSTAISAFIGVASLHVGGMLTVGDVGTAWRAWWLGDAIGNLVVAPALLVWATRTREPPRPARRLPEATALATSVVVVGLLVFGGVGARGGAAFEQAYLVFPPLMWAAIRFGQRGAAFATLLTSVIAVWGTVVGNGPFVQSGVLESLFPLQTFMAVAAGTTLILGASIAERRRAAQALHDAHARVTEANRAKAEFLAVMSHELRTPLNAIAGYVDLIRLEGDGRVSENHQSYLSRIRSNQQHLLSMIEDVLSFTKVEAGQLTLSMQLVRVCDALSALEALLEPEVRRKGLSFITNPCDPSLTVWADPERLRQILLNLLANAVKFTNPGGRVGIDARQERGLVYIRVSDTGIGIPPDQLERVFEPFFQVDRGLTRMYPGTGLGLAIARDFARAMGGDIRLESRPGEGTRAALQLPALSGAARQPEHESNAPEA